MCVMIEQPKDLKEFDITAGTYREVCEGDT